MKRTKIVATFGPAIDDDAVLLKLMEEGVDVFRFNFSHSDPRTHVRNAIRIRKLADEAGKSITLLQDLSGPKLRLGDLPDGTISLSDGEEIILSPELREDGVKVLPVQFSRLASFVSPGDRILLSDGKIHLEVFKVSGRDVYAVVVKGGEVSSRAGINLPGKELDITALTEKDVKDIEIGAEAGFDWVALSFVQRASDVELAKYYLKINGSNAKVVAKIEKSSAVKRFDDIVNVSDGIMIARGDLGLEIPMEELPVIQKRIIRKAIYKGKPVITATQMLDSMIHNPTPTRAEVADVANAVIDGSDALMLSGETAIGKYPVEAVRMMRKVIEEVENSDEYRYLSSRPEWEKEIDESVAYSACELANLSSAKVIVAFTFSGMTAINIAKYRPRQMVLAITPNEWVVRMLGLVWGVKPSMASVLESFEDMVYVSRRKIMQNGLADVGDRIVIVAGLPLKIPGITNLIHITEV